MNSEAMKSAFLITQILVIVLLLLWLLRAGISRSQSGFGLRESDRKRNPSHKSNTTPLLSQGSAADRNMADDVLKIKKPLQLGGIRLDLPAHELLGIRRLASKDEIEDAFKKLMKQYHPDKVARPGSAQWQDAQKIAQALIDARDQLLKRFNK